MSRYLHPVFDPLVAGLVAEEAVQLLPQLIRAQRLLSALLGLLLLVGCELHFLKDKQNLGSKIDTDEQRAFHVFTEYKLRRCISNLYKYKETKISHLKNETYACDKPT